MCDITIAAESANFGQTGPTVGSVPIWGGAEMLRLAYDGAEIQEGMNAFLEKRKPDFGKFRK